MESGDAAYGIVPIENSTEGAVNRTMDCLLKTPLFIVGECSIPIQHNLMTRSGSMEGVTRVYSHPQSLGQCVQWLNRNVPSLERLTAESNGEAARLASEIRHMQPSPAKLRQDFRASDCGGKYSGLEHEPHAFSNLRA